MPNIKSAKKRVKVNAVKAANNKARNTALKTAIKKANEHRSPQKEQFGQQTEPRISADTRFLSNFRFLHLQGAFFFCHRPRLLRK